MAVDLLDLPTSPFAVEPPLADHATAVRALLEDARATVQRGWIKHAWFIVQGRRGRLRPIRPGHLGRIDHTNVTAACLVGALIHAGWLHRTAAGEPAATCPALDLLWTTLHDATAVVPSRSAVERAARSRDLSYWNDAPERRHADVLALFDAAILRTYGSSEILQRCADPQPAVHA